jgi:hypothetical protein
VIPVEFDEVVVEGAEPGSEERVHDVVFGPVVVVDEGHDLAEGSAERGGVARCSVLEVWVAVTRR